MPSEIWNGSRFNTHKCAKIAKGEAIKNAERMLAWFERFFMEIIDLDKIDVEVKLVEIDQDGNQKTEA